MEGHDLWGLGGSLASAVVPLCAGKNRTIREGNGSPFPLFTFAPDVQ